MKWLIYGANGYTGELIAREAKRRGDSPILAGRNREAIEPLARELELEVRIASLDDLPSALAGVDIVLHCAGPFSHTSRAMIDACLSTRTHYLDITGEIAVFEQAAARDREAKDKGIIVLPGVGFDVVPTDCLAAMLAAKVPAADRLELAFHSSRAKTSRGTARTVVENLGRGGAIREDGKIRKVPTLFDVRSIDFGRGPRPAFAIPWGDVSTAYHTTRIPNIRVYSGSSTGTIRLLRLLHPFMPLAKNNMIRKLIAKFVVPEGGPTEEERRRGRMYLWGHASDASGNEATMRMITPEGYTFTVESSLAVIDRLKRDSAASGFFTPSRLLGADFVKSIRGVEIS